jgi:hypothetical protein
MIQPVVALQNRELCIGKRMYSRGQRSWSKAPLWRRKAATPEGGGGEPGRQYEKAALSERNLKELQYLELLRIMETERMPRNAS